MERVETGGTLQNRCQGARMSLAYLSDTPPLSDLFGLTYHFAIL